MHRRTILVKLRTLINIVELIDLYTYLMEVKKHETMDKSF